MQSGLDAYLPNLSDLGTPGSTNYSVVAGPDNLGNVFAFVGGSTGFDDVTGVHFGFHITAGNGGNATIGTGGAGGGLGHSLTTTSTQTDVGGGSTSNSIVGDISITLPASSVFDGDIQLRGGQGGNGFTNGGAGGGIAGVSLTYDPAVTLLTSSATLIAGDGGAAVSGHGGNGGTLQKNHITSGDTFQAGNGGRGTFGGTGGSIIGNQLTNVFDTYEDGGTFTAGTGGHGVKRGGNGGDIVSFAPFFPHLIGQSDGLETFTYVAGNGGDAVAGVGGRGGVVFNSSPSTETNEFGGSIDIHAGNGGRGLIGGAGGFVNGFNNKPTANLPSSISIIAGDGGVGVTGNGGAGGSLLNIDVNGQGFLQINNTTLVGFSRFVAGAGGDSFGAVGGAGGSILSATSAAQSAAVVAAAGRGGDGLLAGGLGGSILNTSFDSAANAVAGLPFGKVLVIAGDGGSAYASLAFNHSDSSLPPTDFDNVKAFGLVNGRGGSGGSIINFTQPKSVNTNVDLIAGNGGDTVNYGSSTDLRVNVGRGGSILNTHITGNIGNSDPTVAIQAYNAPGTTMQEFIDDVVKNSPSTLFTDALGNVGLLAGAAGHLRGGQVANGHSNALNGSVVNLTLSSGSKVASMVAGSVDSIAAIQAIAGVHIVLPNGQAGGPPQDDVLGADKAPFGGTSTGATPGSYDYFDPMGNLVHTAALQSGYGLIDGAIFAKNVGGLTGSRVFARPNG